MTPLTDLWDLLISFENLWLAWRKARRGKAHTAAVAEFALNLEQNLLDLQRDLISQRYRPGTYRLFTIYERKPRQIAAAPMRDRVVHHALMNLIEPPLDKRFIYDSYACRAGKGTHRAVDRYQRWAQRYAYVLKLDIQQYFPSIDHLILQRLIRQRVMDHKVLTLIDWIIDGSPEPLTPITNLFPDDDLHTLMVRRRGIPIGNLTSQFFANLLLDNFDHWIKESLRVKAYLRYVDDMVLLSDSKQQLADWRECIRTELAALRLRLHPNKAHISPTRCGINLLGYHVTPYRRRLANHNGYAFRRRLRRFATLYQQGQIEWESIDASVQSWLGHARHADTLSLREAVLSNTVFVRGTC